MRSWIRPADRRGVLLLGMAALIFVLSMLCAAVLLRSLDAYRASARLEQRLQLQAAAEGTVAVALTRGPDHTPAALQIGDARVALEPVDSTNRNVTITFTVDVLSRQHRLVASARYRAHFVHPAGREWELGGLERLP